jgi:dUTPase
MKVVEKVSLNCNFVMVDPLAIIPTKAHDSDVGYYLSILKKKQDLNETTALYHTGLKATIVENEFYLEIVPRSSLSKSGYIMSNSFGIIDQDYRFICINVVVNYLLL